MSHFPQSTVLAMATLSMHVARPSVEIHPLPKSTHINSAHLHADSIKLNAAKQRPNTYHANSRSPLQQPPAIANGSKQSARASKQMRGDQAPQGSLARSEASPAAGADRLSKPTKLARMKTRQRARSEKYAAVVNDGSELRLSRSVKASLQREAASHPRLETPMTSPALSYASYSRSSVASLTDTSISRHSLNPTSSQLFEHSIPPVGPASPNRSREASIASSSSITRQDSDGYQII